MHKLSDYDYDDVEFLNASILIINYGHFHTINIYCPVITTVQVTI